MTDVRWLIEARSSTLDRRATVDDFQSARFVVRHGEPGEWELAVPADGRVASLLTGDPGAGVVLTRVKVDDDGTRTTDVLLSGPWVEAKQTWGVDENTVKFIGADDSVHAANRICYPEPSVAAGSWTVAEDIETGPAETVMKQLVDVNLGPNALAARQLSGLTVAADQGRGETVTIRGRMQPLQKALTTAALAGGDLGWHIVQSGSGLQFRVYDTSDLTDAVVFSHKRGNLAGYERQRKMPGATVAIVGGGGEGASRTVHETSDPTAVTTWGRIEGFVDERNTTDTGELEQAGDEHLASEASIEKIEADAADTEALRWVDDYDRGDRVTIVGHGFTEEYLLREVELDLTGDAARVMPKVGTPNTTDRVALYRRLRRLDARLGNLERV